MKKIQFVPLSEETREVLASVEAAPHLGLKPATLADWSKDPNAPIKPLRYNKRKLLWRVSDLRALLAGA
jgi:hypothetical protein